MKRDSGKTSRPRQGWIERQNKKEDEAEINIRPRANLLVSDGILYRRRIQRKYLVYVWENVLLYWLPGSSLQAQCAPVHPAYIAAHSQIHKKHMSCLCAICLAQQHAAISHPDFLSLKESRSLWVSWLVRSKFRTQRSSVRFPPFGQRASATTFVPDWDWPTQYNAITWNW